jgi:hypothetical protein
MTSCRQLFKDLNLLPLPCMYIFGIVCHTKLNLEKLEQNNVFHNHDTRQKLTSMFSFGEQMPIRKAY